MVGAIFDITMACAWWWIIVDMKRMSAAVYGQRTLSARALAFAASGPVAVRMAFERVPCAQAATTMAAKRRIGRSRRVRFTAGLESDRIGIGEYRTCTTFDSGDGVKVGYKFLTELDLRRGPVTPSTADVVIIGAGAAGLAAARDLSQRGIRTVVLEARDRVGGRIHSIRDDASPMCIELGAEFVHGSAPLTRRLVREGELTICDVAGERWRSERSRLVRAQDYWRRLNRVTRLLDEHREPDRSIADFRRRVPAVGDSPGSARCSRSGSAASTRPIRL